MRHLQRSCSKAPRKAEKYEFDFERPGEVISETAFEGEDGIVMRYALDDAEINGQLGALLPAHLADLIDIAVAVYMADRLAVRGATDQSSDWHRTVQLNIPVRLIDLWQRADVQHGLSTALEFLTEDDWRLRFCQRPASFLRVAESQQPLFPDQFAGPVHVSLLSGGLDSFVGTAAAIAHNPHSHFVCVSGVANQRHGDRQRQQVRSLKNLHPLSLTHIRVACWLKDADEVRQEPTRRTRGFLFLALGAVAALAARADRLWLYENGIGALNLPFARTELGVTTSRSVHPKTLDLMGALVSLVSGSAFTIRNGSVLQTKAQMCSDPAISPVFDTIPATFSCDSFPLRRQGASQCGVCTSCLLRRLALFNAGLQDRDSRDYQHDVYSPDALDERHLRGAFEMDWQVARLAAALGQEDAWLGLLSEFPSVSLAQQSLARQLALPASVVADRLVGLYRRHCDEWCRFPGSLLAQLGRKAA